ncbi:MAG: glycosyltransferase family 2 protein [Xanthobacteraceae bacterium]|nr:glycosyltransferase family 2 protein [Xanthobacteraceae bacterium]
MSRSLHAAFVAASPRLTHRVVPFLSVAIYVAVVGLWVGLFAHAFQANNIIAWSSGMVYIVYDCVLLVVVALLTWPLLSKASLTKHQAVATSVPARPTLGVLISAFNEAEVLSETLLSLCNQSDRPDEILVIDDGSTDDMVARLREKFGIVPNSINRVSAPSPSFPLLRLLQLNRSGKAAALNAGIGEIGTDIVITIDADTVLASDALAQMRGAFARDAALVAAGGVLVPMCDRTPLGRVLQWFQTYEYIRNMVSRFAWMSAHSLLLISGAFAAFRRDALIAVGGFDTQCLVEDYELSHRLHRYAVERGLDWRLQMVGTAHAITHAPGTFGTFLRQRRRWFAGFLQTQYWNRDMTGNPRFGRLGTLMMPIKAIDTMQPIYGLTGFALLLAFWLLGKSGIAELALGLVGAKILIDFAFGLWIVHLYRVFTGDRVSVGYGQALLAAAIEPFSFQLLRHTGAAWGWVWFLSGRKGWGRQQRSALGVINGSPAARP